MEEGIYNLHDKAVDVARCLSCIRGEIVHQCMAYNVHRLSILLVIAIMVSIWYRTYSLNMT